MAHTSESEDLGASAPAESWLQARIIDAAGQPASIVSVQSAGLDTLAWVRVGDGPQVLVPTGVLVRQTDGSYRLPFSFVAGGEQETRVRIPVLQEELQVGKREVDTGKGVRIRKTVLEEERTVDQLLQHDELVVEHVAVGTPVDEQELPQPRQEGDTLILPILEEVAVVQKQLYLKEEVRITRRKREEHVVHTLPLRSEQVTVERFGEGRDKAV